jgi:nucleotide-binding universal stress UspA family protein
VKPPFSKIVAATDFSPSAERASARAAMVASAHGAPLGLVHVVSASGLASLRAWIRDPADLPERLVSDAATCLQAAAKALGRGVRSRLIQGEVVEQLRAATSPEVLVVVGAHGAGTLGDLLIGSTAERLVSECAGPVLVVRDDPRGPYSRALAGMDLEAGCPGLLAQLAAFAPDARITALHAYEVPFESTLTRAGVAPAEVSRLRADAVSRAHEAIRRSSEAATGDADRVLPLVDRGDPARLLVEHGRATGAELLAVARRSRPWVHAMLIGSVARRVVAEADRDVLVLRGPATQGR